jgi:hypothetical protein
VLLAYQDSALADDDDRLVADHLRLCDHCREYLTSSREIGVLLRRHMPVIDDPQGLEELKRRLREPIPPPRAVRNRFVFGRTAVLCVSVVVLLGVGLLTSRTIEGGSSFTGWFVDDASPRRVRSDGPGEGTPLVAPPMVGVGPELPFDLVQINPSGMADDQVFQSARGLAISVVVELGGDSRIYADGTVGMTEIVSVDGHEVYVSSDETAVGRAVVLFHWIHEDRLVSVFVLSQPVGGLDVEAAMDIVAALIPRLDRETH